MKQMKCPYCANECAEGIVRSKGLRAFSSFGTETLWYPKDQEGRLFKGSKHSLNSKTAAYYCAVCRKVYAEYDVYPRPAKKKKDTDHQE
ncbi:MAG: hypothetical protein IKG55_08575 [Solobacterium sp.]|nr:hypothetical protein [Solobacterium sp.]